VAAPRSHPGVQARRYVRRDGSVTERYAVRFEDALGVRRRATFEGMDEALDFQAELRLARRKHGVAAAPRGELTLSEFFSGHCWPKYAATELEQAPRRDEAGTPYGSLAW
jgi:hypothetical protein